MRKFFLSIAILAVSNCVSSISPCDKYQTDANKFVAHGAGYARHYNTAKIKAQMDANVNLKKEILRWIRNLTDQYIVEANLDQTKYSQIFDFICEQKIEEQMDYASVICNKQGDNIDGMLSVYVTMAIDRKFVLESFRRVFSADSRLNKNYDDGKFLALYKADKEKLKSMSKSKSMSK